MKRNVVGVIACSGHNEPQRQGGSVGIRLTITQATQP